MISYYIDKWIYMKIAEDHSIGEMLDIRSRRIMNELHFVLHSEWVWKWALLSELNEERSRWVGKLKFQSSASIKEHNHNIKYVYLHVLSLLIHSQLHNMGVLSIIFTFSSSSRRPSSPNHWWCWDDQQRN